MELVFLFLDGAQAAGSHADVQDIPGCLGDRQGFAVGLSSRGAGGEFFLQYNAARGMGRSLTARVLSPLPRINPAQEHA